jgi:hypothetical protein
MKTKPHVLLICCLIAVSNLALSQSASDVFNNSETPITYLGVDFTKAKLIGDDAANELDIRDRQFAGINDVIVNEPKRYDIKAAFNKSTIEHDLSLVSKRNKAVNAENLKSSNSSDFRRLKEADINTLVKGFDFGGKKGVGLLFVMEGMSKTEKAAALWVTLIDMKSKKVLMTDRMETKVAGLSFRNYWASSVRNALETIDKTKYKEWKQRYSNRSL